MDFTFSELENKLLLNIAQKPRAIQSLYREYVENGPYSRAGFYKALSNLKTKGVIRSSERVSVVCINSTWVIEGRRFFKNLRAF